MKRRAAKSRFKRRIRNLCAGTILVLCICMSFGAFLVSAHENTGDETVYTYYKSIEIQPGDTLWDIAEDTMPAEYDSTAEYVQVLKAMNDLDSDDIQAGQHLMITYNDTEFIQ